MYELSTSHVPLQVTFTASAKERLQCVEPLFNTTLVKLNEKPLPTLVAEAVLAATNYATTRNFDLVQALLRQVMFVGGYVAMVGVRTATCQGLSVSPRRVVFMQTLAPCFDKLLSLMPMTPLLIQDLLY
jgi:hypothetical protein